MTRLLSTCAALAAAWPCAVLADDLAPEVIVTANLPQPAETPGGVDVVPAAVFENRLAVSLRDALAFSPGVYLQPRFGQEVRVSIRGSGISRGFHMRGLLLFQDGVPINLADNNGDLQELDPQVFERLTVYRGGNALRLGGSTLGGAIDAATPTGRSDPGVTLRADGGSFDTARFKAAAGMATERGDAWLALTGDRSDGDRAHAARRSLRFNGNAAVRLAPALETRFYASLNRIRQELPGALTRAQALSTPRLSLPANIAGDQARDIDSIRLQNRTTLDLGQAGTLSAGAFVNAKQLYHPIFQVIDQQSTDWGVFARADLAGAIGAMPVEASLGTTARFGTVRARQYVNVAGRRGAQTADADQRARTIDSYAELRATPVARLTLVAGALVTNAMRAVDNNLNAARSGRAEFTRLSPKVGLLYETGGVTLFGNVSRSVEPPGFSELNQTPFAVNGTVTPGFVPIAPQRAWTGEAGARGTIGPARFDVTLYRSSLRGEFLQFDQGPNIPAATFNAGSTRHQGIEAGLELDLARWASLRQTWTLSDFRFRGDAQFGNNRLPVVPVHAGRTALRLGTADASVTPTLEWVPRGAWADYANTVRVPGYALLGVAGEIRVGRTTLFVDARNLTGNKAIGDISAVVRATSASAIYYPVERRAFYAGIRARL